jgi:hypothetical protein
MKLKTKIDALQKSLIAAETAKAEASKKVEFAAGTITMKEIWADDERITRAALSARKAVREEWRANGAWRALPKPRRDWAKEAKKWAEDQARHGLDFGGDYSGNTSQSICWGDSSRAYTIKCRGEKYSRSCKYSKMDAEHIVQLCAEDVARLDGWRQIAQASAAEGLPIIGLMEDGRFIWVRSKGKAIVARPKMGGSDAMRTRFTTAKRVPKTPRPGNRNARRKSRLRRKNRQQHKGTMMKTNTCTRCGHKWYPRTPERPRVCPKCKSPYWDKPRKVKGTK